MDCGGVARRSTSWGSTVTAADVRDRLTRAPRLDLVGPEPDESQTTEILDREPSRWYLTGFLAPTDAPESQKSDETDEGDLDSAVGPGGDEDESTPEPPAARRGYFPSSMGVRVLVPPDVEELRITARWGDYEPLEIAAEGAESRTNAAMAADVVWTGPEAPVSHTRDTSVVVEELFANAQHDVLVSS